MWCMVYIDRSIYFDLHINICHGSISDHLHLNLKGFLFEKEFPSIYKYIIKKKFYQLMIS